MTAKTIHDVVEVFSNEFHIVDPIPIQVALGAVIANHLPGDPVWLLLVGPPSSGKTEIISSLSGLPDIHEVSTFTEAGLLSGAPSRNPKASGGLLRQFRTDARDGTFGILTFKDLTSIISEASDTRASLLAALREIYDGCWIRRLGTEGGKTLAWKGKAGLIGAVTETIDRQAAVMGAMGERFILVRMPTLDEEQRLDHGRSTAEQGSRSCSTRTHQGGCEGTPWSHGPEPTSEPIAGRFGSPRRFHIQIPLADRNDRATPPSGPCSSTRTGQPPHPGPRPARLRHGRRWPHLGAAGRCAPTGGLRFDPKAPPTDHHRHRRAAECRLDGRHAR